MSNRKRRIATVLAAPAAALAGWALIRLAGIDLEVSTDPGTVRAGDVVAAALVAALGAWGVVLMLERWTSRPGAYWPFVASTALALSMIGPSYLADGASAVALMALHFVTAVVVIGGFASTLACGDCELQTPSLLKRTWKVVLKPWPR
jgi:hypothetical protein